MISVDVSIHLKISQKEQGPMTWHFQSIYFIWWSFWNDIFTEFGIMLFAEIKKAKKCYRNHVIHKNFFFDKSKGCKGCSKLKLARKLPCP